MPDPTTTARTEAGGSFQPTVWTVVLNSENKAALERLCIAYWPPVYSYLRRRGQSPEDAKDLTQGFFVHLLSKERLKNVHPAKGKFRSFLLACLNNYVQHEWQKQRSQKRGGGLEVISIDIADTEQRYGVTPVDAQDPAKLFEQRWARALLAQVLVRLKQRWASDGKAELFAVLQPYLTGESGRGDYSEAATKLEMSDGAVRVAASRLRGEFRDLLREEVGQTVESPAEIEEEIRHLFGAFRAP